ncbi:MAG: DUF1045 domain-containing protein [Pseudorhodobacter sp.]|nr:DUF1045 domain-containing protein [Pseudorhodobacter sp.]
MDQMKRFAVYYAPRPGGFATRTAAWLGWDAQAGVAQPTPDLADLPLPLTSLTADPAKYGFHGTIRAPFRATVNASVLAAEVATLARRLPPVVCDGLRLQSIDGFLALTPEGGTASLLELGAAVVEATNALRAPLTAAEIGRRRPERLTSRQRILLDQWGYPHVMEEFQFHLTLTSRLAPDIAAPVARVLTAWLAPVLPRPFVIEDLCLFGEDAGGRFQMLHRYALTG